MICLAKDFGKSCHVIITLYSKSHTSLTKLSWNRDLNQFSLYPKSTFSKVSQIDFQIINIHLCKYSIRFTYRTSVNTLQVDTKRTLYIHILQGPCPRNIFNDFFLLLLFFSHEFSKIRVGIILLLVYKTRKFLEKNLNMPLIFDHQQIILGVMIRFNNYYKDIYKYIFSI